MDIYVFEAIQTGPSAAVKKKSERLQGGNDESTLVGTLNSKTEACEFRI